MDTNKTNKNILNNKFIIPRIVSIVLFMEFLDTTIINTAIPSIAKSFYISPITLKFSVAVYLLSLAIFIPISGYCADKFGTKKIFLLSVGLFTLSSFLCAISHNIYQLTIFRFLQGVGGALMNPVSRIIIIRLFPAKELVRIQGFIFTPAMLGAILGPFLGGLITTYLSWHWIFYINIPAGLIILYLGNKYIEQQKYKTKPFDWAGFILVASSLSAITFWIEMLYHYEIISKNTVFLIGIIGIILFLILIIYCIKSPNAIFDISVFQIKSFHLGLSIYINLYLINSSLSFLLPLMYQEAFHLTPAKSGMLTLPIAFAFLIFRSFVTKIIVKFGFKNTIITATFFLAISLILIANINYNTSTFFIILSEFMYGGAWITIGASVGALNYIDIPTNQTSVATSIDMTSRQFSCSLGVGLGAFCLASLAQYYSVDIFSSDKNLFHYTFYFITIFVIIIAIQALKLDKNEGKIINPTK